MNLFCKLGWHNFHTAPNGMLRYCTNCNLWEVNRNASCDPIKCWREIDDEAREKLIKCWWDGNKVL
jgi:hypothetical protein